MVMAKRVKVRLQGRKHVRKYMLQCYDGEKLILIIYTFACFPFLIEMSPGLCLITRIKVHDLNLFCAQL